LQNVNNYLLVKISKAYFGILARRKNFDILAIIRDHTLRECTPTLIWKYKLIGDFKRWNKW